MKKERSRHWKRADKYRQTIADYKVERGCVDCGYKGHSAALEFDHLPGTKKSRTVASLMYWSLEAVFEEIAKCEIVCANCHAIRTFERKNAVQMLSS
jgi:hypothetical protein